MQISTQLHNRYQEIFNLQLAHSTRAGRSSVAERKVLLKKLCTLLLERSDALKTALASDLRRHEAESDAVDIIPTLSEIKTALRGLKSWVKPKKTGNDLLLTGTSSYVLPQPKGVVLIIGPWNYPFMLVMSPLISALAAGNCAVIKPSELTPATSRFIAELVRDCFPPELVSVVEGGADVAETLLELPFNHIFFTGSSAVGKIVMHAAANHLCSVTLELGGKSPAIVDKTADLDRAASTIAWGKLLNNGMTCVSPDYLLVHSSVKEALLQKIVDCIDRMYGPDWQLSPYLARMVNDKNFNRVVHLIEDARERGAKVYCGAKYDPSTRYIAPTLLTEVPEDSDILKEEIFGPVLPVLEFEKLETAYEFIQRGPRPLGAYFYSRQQQVLRDMIQSTRSGGAAINNSVVQFANAELPFGGDQNSGFGKAHGFAGFMAFSNERGILVDHFSLLRLFYPPYTHKRKQLISLVKRYLSW